VHWETELELRRLIAHREQELAAMMMNAPTGASELSDGCLTALTELDDLLSELEFRFGGPSDEIEAAVRVPLKPLPHLNNAGVAIPEPGEPEAD